MKRCDVCSQCFEDDVNLCPTHRVQLKPELEGSQVFDGKYLIEKRLGHGAMGVVYQVRHLGLQKRLALKMIHPGVRSDSNFLSRFKTEAEVLGRLTHANIVSVTDFGIDMRGNGTPYLVMEYLEGESLDSYLKREGKLDLKKALSFLRQLGDALDYAHGKGVLHRDLKPSNIFIVKDGERESVKILDFGVARFFKADFSTLTMLGIRDERVVIAGKDSDEDSGSRPTYLDAYYRPTNENQEENDSAAHRNIVGTWIYMAPEVFRGKPPTVATDVYAFGILIYEMIAGQPPFRGNIMYLRNHHLHKPVPSPLKFNSDLPRDIVKPVLAPLAKSPDDRPQSVTQTVGMLQMAFHQSESRRWRSAEQPRRWWFAIGLSLIILLITFLMEIFHVGAPLARRISDVQFLYANPVNPTPTVSLILVHEQEITRSGKQAPEAMARLVHEAFKAGAAHVAINVLLPENWSRSASWAEVVIEHHERLTFAAFANLQGQLVGTTWAERGPVIGVLGPEKTAAMFGLSNVFQDSDTMIRRGYVALENSKGQLFPSFASQATQTFFTEDWREKHQKDGFPINFAVSWLDYANYEYKDAEMDLNTRPEAFAGKLILIGYSADDEPFLQGRIPNIEGQNDRIESTYLQALTIQTILDGFPIKKVPLVLCLILLETLLLILAWFFLQYQRLLIPTLVLVVTTLGYLAAAFFLFKYHLIQLPILIPAIGGSAFIGAVLLIRRHLGPFPGDQTMNGSRA